MEELTRILSWIEELSPEVWRIYVHRQYVSGQVRIGTGAFLLVLSIVSSCISVWAYKKRQESEDYDERKGYDDLKLFGLIVMAIALFVGVIILLGGVNALLTPEYHAIKDLLSVLE